MTAPVVAHYGGAGQGAAPVICRTAVQNGLGFSAYQSWAFRRAELTAFAESPFRLPSGERLTMAHIRSLPPELLGVDRLLALGAELIGELLEDFPALPVDLPFGALVALPERMGDAGTRAGKAARRRIEESLGEGLAARGLSPLVRTLPRGHAALAFALSEAAEALRAGAVELAVVGGLDTHYDPEVIDALADAGRLFDGADQDTFIPGEGGALLLLTRPDVARRLGLEPLLRIESVAMGTEVAVVGSDVPSLGQGLSRPARALCDRLQREGRTLDWWITDMTAEERRTTELQLVWPRIAQGVATTRSQIDHLYGHFGDLGAAAMPTGLAIASEGMLRGDPRATSCLVTGSSDGPDRGAVLLARPG